jgi:nucleotide-binding universal stress UspA family protein
MQRVVVGVDGSTAADAALRWSGRLAGSTGAEVVAVHAFRYPHREISADERERLLAERATLLADQWVRPAVDAPGAVRSKVEAGDPRTVVLATAEAEGADLLVLGRTGRGGGPGFLHLGSVVEHAAHHTRCPLAVIPSDVFGPIRRIVIGVDGSVAAAAAVDWCAELASSVNAEVVAVTVAEPIVELTPSWDEKNWRRDAERDIQTWVAALADAGVAVDAVATENLHPADGLLGVSSARAADLIVLGTRGAGGFTGLRFGGVAMKVLHRAFLPLVLVPTMEER